MKRLVTMAAGLMILSGCVVSPAPYYADTGVVVQPGVILEPEIALGFYDPMFGYWDGRRWDREYYGYGHGGYGHDRYHGPRNVERSHGERGEHGRDGHEGHGEHRR